MTKLIRSVRMLSSSCHRQLAEPFMFQIAYQFIFSHFLGLSLHVLPFLGKLQPLRLLLVSPVKLVLCLQLLLPITSQVHVVDQDNFHTSSIIYPFLFKVGLWLVQGHIFLF